MQIVIDIPEEMYKWVNDVNKIFDDYGTSDFIDLIKDGTPLPKEHGRIIDESQITGITFVWDDGFVECFAPTIIDAESEE